VLLSQPRGCIILSVLQSCNTVFDVHRCGASGDGSGITFYPFGFAQGKVLRFMFPVSPFPLDLWYNCHWGCPMFSIISQLLTAFGLASASGLNAYIPLLTVALIARLTNLLKLNPPFDILTNEWVIGVLVLLLIVEIVVDKIPAADTINDVIQTFVRPTAGAILFAASTSAIDLNPILAVILGLVLAFGVHATKATARPVVTASTGGIGNPVVSTAEDVVSLVVSILALAVPILIGIVLALIIAWLVWRVFFRPRAMV